MTIDNIPVEHTLETVKRQLDEEKNLSPALRASLELLVTLVTLLLNRLGLNSRNSSKPPGGQQGHAGNHLPGTGR